MFEEIVNDDNDDNDDENGHQVMAIAKNKYY